MLLVLGGIRTEVQYFEYVKKELSTAGIDVHLVAEGWTPMKLHELAVTRANEEVRNAKKSGDDSNVYDEVWVVSDVDEFADELKRVINTCESSGVKLAITNPCFESWLSMHVDGGAAQLNRHQAQSLAKKQGLVDKDNAKYINVEPLRGKFGYAASNSRRLAEAHNTAGSKFPNNIPASDVDLLVGSILSRALKSNPDLTTNL